MDTLTQDQVQTGQDLFPILGTDHIEFYVGNAKQAAHYYQSAWGFRIIAYRGPETGTRDRASYVLEQGKIRFVLTSALSPDHEIAQHAHRHGDGVRVLALWVDDAEHSYRTALARGAESALPLEVLSDENGTVRTASIKTYGDTIHTFVERHNYQGVFLPGFKPRQSQFRAEPIGLKYVDHCVGNVELGMMNHWAAYWFWCFPFSIFLYA